VIVGGGKPFLVPLSSYAHRAAKNEGGIISQDVGRYRGDATTPEGKSRWNKNNIKDIITYLKDQKHRATDPENDLFEAILLAGELLNDCERDFTKRLREKRIIIMDSGIVTKGYMNFVDMSLDAINFENAEDVASCSAEIIMNLKAKIPKNFNLNGVQINFLGFCNVASPQEIDRQGIEGLRDIWINVLKELGAVVDTSRFPRSEISDPPITIDDALPPIIPVAIGTNTSPESITINFARGSAMYLNPDETEMKLNTYAERIKRHISSNSDVRYYLVGAESKKDYSGSWALSEERAAAVKKSLVRSLNITLKDSSISEIDSKIIAFGLGINDPPEWRDPEETDSGAAKNRKVLIFPSTNKRFVAQVEAARRGRTQ
jgi:outer membrane protein OmpA-like peptidoglycan-associated protein